MNVLQVLESGPVETGDPSSNPKMSASVYIKNFGVQMLKDAQKQLDKPESSHLRAPTREQCRRLLASLTHTILDPNCLLIHKHNLLNLVQLMLNFF